MRCGCVYVGQGGGVGSNLQDCCSAGNIPAFNSEDGSFTRQPKAGNVQASSDQTTRIVAQVQNEGVTASLLQVDTPSVPQVTCAVSKNVLFLT